MQYGIPITLDANGVPLYFNDLTAYAQGYFRIEDIGGGDSASVRTTIDAMPQRDGAIVNDAFLGSMTIVIEGTIVPFTTGSGMLTNRAELEVALRNRLRRILRADGTLKWTPTGHTAVQRTVRLNDGLVITNDGILKRFHISLVAADPNIYSQTNPTSTSGIYSGTPVTLVVNNAGDTDTYPMIRMYGAATGPKLTNNTTGKTISYRKAVGTDTSGLPIAATTWVDSHHAEEYALVSVFNGTWYKTQYIDPAVSEFFPLAPGNNTIQLDVTSGWNATTKFSVTWRDAWS